MEPSKFQTAIYQEVKNGSSDILVKATAGSGKTTTIVNASKFIPQGKDVMFLAFNKSIVEELKTRLPDHVQCSTLHSLGFRSLYKYYRTNGGFDVSGYKTTKFAKDVSKNLKIGSKDLDKALWVANDILDKARLNHVENDFKLLGEISDYYGIIWENKEMELAQMTYEQLMEYNEIKFSDVKKLVDFTDMIYLPSFYNVELGKYDIVFVDEAQDLNKSQQILVQKIKKPNGRAIYVGDENQAIYMFAGADAKSFNSIADENTVSLPLSVCYRCGKNIIKEAQEVVGEEAIQPFEGQIEGEILHGSIDDIKEGDFVLCRNNAPLFSLYFDLIQKGIKAKIKGREIENQLLKLVHKIRFSTIEQGRSKLDLMLEKIEDELVKKGKAPEKSKKWQNFREMSNIISFLAEGKLLMSEVGDQLNEIFDENKPGATLMTIHKSKGLEAERVHFLLPELIPSKWAETDEEYKQEFNLKFVAITRAQKTLNYIKGYENRIPVG